MNRNRPRVAHWKSDWLPPTETFVASQISSLRAWDQISIGTRSVDSVLTKGDEIIVYGTGRLEKIHRRLFEMTRRSHRIRLALQKSGAQVVHAHFANEGSLIRREAGRLGIPVVVSMYGSDVTALAARSGPKGYVFRLRLRAMFRTASKLLAISESIAASAIAIGAPASKVVVQRVGVDIDGYPNVDANNRHGILFIGRLVPKKGLSELFGAMALLPQYLRQFEITVIGDGPLRVELEEEAKALDLKVSFLGYLPPLEIEQAMLTHEVLCAPSITAPNGDSEGLPTVLVQAGACRIPVIAYAHGGIPEIIRDHENGLLVEEGDRSALAAAIQFVLSDESIRTAMGNAARTVVERHFNAAQQGRALEAIYASALDRRPS